MIDQANNALMIVASLLEARTGQKLTADRLWRVSSALAGVQRHYGLDTLEDLAAELVRPGQAALAQQVVEALLNNETYFFRDRAMFDQLANSVLPALAERRQRTRRLSLWSVGCSSGQEVYSLAMLFAEAPARWHGWTIDIVGTDVAAAVIDTARRGNYSQFQIQRGLGVAQMVRFFDEAGAGWQANAGLRGMVRFGVHNLLDTAPDPGRFDLVLCRNVLLYFDRDTRARAFERLGMALASDGYVMLGAGETSVGQTELFVPEKGHTGFHQLAAGNAPAALLPKRMAALR